MSFRPDAPAFNLPPLLTERPIVTLSTDDEPTVDNDNGELVVGQTWLQEDSGALKYWDGDEWKPAAVEQIDALRLNLLFDIRDLLSGE